MTTPDFQSLKLTKPVAGGPYKEDVVDAIHTSVGAADAGKLVVLNASGQIDPSMGGGGGTTDFGSLVGTTPSTGQTLQVGNGSTLTITGTGVINANEISGIAVPTSGPGSAPTHQGQLLISQPGNLTAHWADPFVQGPWVNGTAVVTPGAMGDGTSNIQPIFVAGYDGTNMRGLLTSSTGQLHIIVDSASLGTVTISGSVTIASGTVTANQGTPNTAANSWPVEVTDGTNILFTSSHPGVVNQGTSPWITSDQNFVAIGSTTSGEKGLLSLGAVTTAPPTYTTGQSAPLSIDTAGNLRVNATVTGGGGTQYADGTTQATPTGTVAMGKDATNVLHSLKLDGSQNLDVNTQAAVFAAVDGAALPADTVWMGASDGTNLRGLQVESSTNKNLRVAIYQGGNEVNVTSNRLLVDPSGTTIAVTQSTSPWVTSDNNAVTQGSTTAGEKGFLQLAAVSTADPSYTTAQTSPLSLTITGHLRTQDAAEGVANGSTAPPTNAMYVAGKGADGFLHPLSTDNSGILNVNASFSGTVTPGFVTDRIQSGTISSGGGTNQAVSISSLGAASIVFNITGSWTATLTFQAQLADNSWITATAYPVFTGGAGVTQTTANGQWQLPIAGFQAFRVFTAAAPSVGTATISIEAGVGAFSSFVEQLTATNLNATVTGTVTSNQGNKGTIGQSWFVEITDGSSVALGTSANPFIIAGTKTNNNAAPGSNNVGVLPALANAAAPSYTDGDQVLLSVDTTGALRVSSSGTFTPALTADITATGTITNTQNVTLVTQGTGTTQFNITGSWTGTIVFEASVDGVNFVAAKCIPRYPTSFPLVSQTTANGQWSIATGGLAKFRLRGNNVNSGTATIWIEGGAGSQDLQTIAYIVDPVSGDVPAVKAASTVPVAADQALVVSLSPNSSQFATSTTANAPAQTAVGASTSAILNANTARKECTIVNTGTTVIFLGLGQTPTTSAYHIALAKCTAANDGTGGTYTTDMFKGTINAIGSAGGGSVCVTELT